MARPDTPVPYLELLAGAAWWVVGAAALDGGPATVVLAAGLAVTGALGMAVRRRHGGGAPLSPGRRARLVRLAVGAFGLVAASLAVLGLTDRGELAVPVVCALVGAVLMPLSSLLEERTLVGVGGVLLVLGAVGALLALNTAGLLHSQGVVGLVAGALLWAAGAWRAGLIDEVRAGSGR